MLGDAPQWTDEVVDEVLSYPRPPTDRPRELARFIARLRTFRSHVPGAPGTAPEAAPVRVVHRVVTPTVTVRQPFHTPRLDSVADVADWLGLSIVELEWFADVREINRRATDRRLRHYTYRWLNGRLIELLAGLVVNARPAVPRTEYDAPRALLHNAIYTGLDEQNRDGHPDFVTHLAGRIAWVGHRHPRRAAKLQALFERALAGPPIPASA